MLHRHCPGRISKPDSETLRDYARLCFPIYNRTAQDEDAMARVRRNFDVMLDFGGGEDRSFSFLPNLSVIRCPTLTLGGEEDPITPLADQEDIAAAIPGKWIRFERFANCGHCVFRDAPEAAFQVIGEFISA